MNLTRKIAVVAGCLGATLTAGTIGASMIGVASAQTDSSTTSTPAVAATTTPAAAATPQVGTRTQGDPSKGGHTANGITEVVLTGDQATKATAAAQTAVPGATVDRVETDAEGDAFEAHVTKADGTKVTVKFNADFGVASIQTGMK